MTAHQKEEGAKMEERMLNRLEMMINEADFECSTKYPFQSLTKNVPVSASMSLVAHSLYQNNCRDQLNYFIR